MAKLLKEYYKLNSVTFKSKKGNGYTIVYVDPKTSTDSTYENRELLKKYRMVWLPNTLKFVRNVPYAWGWVIWEGKENEVYPLIKKFAAEIGQQETPPEGGNPREMDDVLADLEAIKQVIMDTDFEGKDALVRKAEEFKDALVKGIGSKETMDALEKLIQYRNEMKRHRGHQLSFMNTILLLWQRPDATDVRSKTDWKKMGYMVKPGAKGIVLCMPAAFKKYFGEKLEAVIRDFLERAGVESEDELTPSQKSNLDRACHYPDRSAGFKGYFAYDISDVIAGKNAEQFPKNEFAWYDSTSDETEKERALIDACIAFGKSIGVREYNFVQKEKLGGSRGNASFDGVVNIVDDKKNHGLLSTVIHETAHQIMHWEVVKNTNPNEYEKFYRGGVNTRGTEIVEQEAELCAWIVLSGFGYRDQQEHFNYLRNWGMDEKNCKEVFDKIFSVSDFIYDGMLNNLHQINKPNKQKKM